MIWIRLTDRLGNQMFQYATALGVANRVGTQVAVDVSSFVNRKAWRDYQLWRFSKLRLGRLPRQTVRTLFRPDGLKVLSPTGSGYCPELALAGDDTLLRGFFQSERHFVDVRDEVVDLFDLRPFLKRKRIAAVHDRFGARSLVSIHVRRGDYVKVKLHNLGDMTAYYHRAAQIVLAAHADAAFVVFSDDPAWCRASPMLDGLDALVLDADAALADMALMASCQHHIIANSTFSWWAAWLGQNPDRMVMLPDRWFRGVDTRDIGITAMGWTEVATAA
ncbi:MAG: alpha-1,2-fucosyltransferase [Bauldia sp.]|nr:alpha-1,2-fucosyltransferase [Bauldia sp.]